ncbi:MAG: acetyl-CoA carboxylase biotin carboxylase subunit [Myxococcota bacterium]
MAGFRRLFISNRGEVAVRIARSCEAVGVVPVLGLSAADLDAPWARERETVCLGPGPAEHSYLDAERVVQAARQARCSALHPGWGFLAESPLLAALCRQFGIAFVGPTPRVMIELGRKLAAKRAMAAAGLPVLAGSEGVLCDLDAARRAADDAGYPVLLKSDAGGGGRGLRIVREPGELEPAWESARAEAAAAFGDPALYLEKLVEGGRHVEIQVLADHHGRVVHLGERDCSVQRHHQKLVEESPAPGLDPDERARVAEAALRAVAAIGYRGAGTLEFLLDPADGRLRFMEMNARLQVEHPVSEMRCGLDLVAWQLKVAAGVPIDLRQEDIDLRGHAIECRINAEDPDDGFRPAPGRVSHFRAPPDDGGRVRVDTHIESGTSIPPLYDSLLCKIVAWGEDRDEACDRMQAALDALECVGVPTTAPLHRAILASEEFRQNRHHTGRIPGWPA